MNDLFRDQMLKSGLVSKKQARKAEHEVKQKSKKQRKAVKSGVQIEEGPSGTEEAARALAEKAEKARTLNAELNAERKEKEIQAQLRDLILAHRIKGYEGDIRHNFAHGSRVKEIHVCEETHHLLGHGIVGIVCLEGSYYILPRSIVLKVEERAPETVILLADTSAEMPEDDPYAAYQVPEDLMW
jgi:uncharacterized protein YaiL (DUF2058 family)